jgi:transposase
MKRFIEGADRAQRTLLPACIDDYVAEDNPVRVIEAFVDELDLGELGFEGVEPEATGRPGYRPSSLLKIYITATSTAYSPVAAWNTKASATSS